MKKQLAVKGVAVVAILAGIGVLVIEIDRFRSGQGIEIWLWGVVAVAAIVFGVYELVAGKGDAEG